MTDEHQQNTRQMADFLPQFDGNGNFDPVETIGRTVQGLAELQSGGRARPRIAMVVDSLRGNLTGIDQLTALHLLGLAIHPEDVVVLDTNESDSWDQNGTPSQVNLLCRLNGFSRVQMPMASIDRGLSNEMNYVRSQMGQPGTELEVLNLQRKARLLMANSIAVEQGLTVLDPVDLSSTTLLLNHPDPRAIAPFRWLSKSQVLSMARELRIPTLDQTKSVDDWLELEGRGCPPLGKCSQFDQMDHLAGAVRNCP